MRCLVCIALLFVLAVPAFADMTGAGDASITLQLTKMNATLQAKYAALMKSLNEFRVQSKFLGEMVDKARMMKREYEFVQNFEVKDVLNRVKNDYEGLTFLDNLDGKTTEEQLDMMLADIDRRFYSPDPEEKKIKHRLKGRIKELQRLQALLKAKIDEANDLTKDDSNLKTINGSIATTNCLLLGLEVQRQQRKILEDAQDINEEMEMSDKLDDFKHALRKMGKGASSVQ